jgi:predicted lipoprotein with Yx(FWY)xxD motif
MLSVRHLTVGIAIVAVAGLSGCAAVSNKTAQESNAAASESAAPTHTAAPAPPNPLPVDDARQSVGPVSLKLEKRGDLGTILAEGTGRALYTFSQETGNQPACYDACADTFLPVLTSGDPDGGVGIEDAEAKTTLRRDGTKQVSYKGHPLYLYAGDKDDKAVNGQGLTLFGGTWHALSGDGQPIA